MHIVYIYTYIYVESKMMSVELYSRMKCTFNIDIGLILDISLILDILYI